MINEEGAFLSACRVLFIWTILFRYEVFLIISFLNAPLFSMKQMKHPKSTYIKNEAIKIKYLENFWIFSIFVKPGPKTQTPKAQHQPSQT